MDKNKIIINILNIPNKFHDLKNISIHMLLKETEYLETYQDISETDIFKVLLKHPEYTKQWLDWSEDKRSNSGWYFKQNEKKKFIVGYFSIKENYKRTEFSDIKEACATFIKREIEEIRNNR